MIFHLSDRLRTMKSPSSSSAPAPNTPVSAERLAKSPCAPKTFNKSVSIIDILRVRVYDEKPMVRAKAVQTFGKYRSRTYVSNYFTSNVHFYYDT